MPVCTNCTAYVDYVYTQYSENNIRLEQCDECKEFADEYVQKDALNLTLDLILLKSVLLHLLYNRGTAPCLRLVDRNGTHMVIKPDRKVEMELGEKRRLRTILQVGSCLILLDSVVRWCHSNPLSLPKERDDIPLFLTMQTLHSFLQTLISCLIETTLFHFGILLACTLVFSRYGILLKGRSDDTSGVYREFRLSRVSLALIYSSLTKFFLLTLLLIWRPTESRIPVTINVTAFNDGVFSSLFHIFDDNKIHREWLLRNLMGGMASGFAIRVVLNGRPMLAAFVVLFGWCTKAGVAYLLFTRLGGPGVDRDWLIFSMP